MPQSPLSARSYGHDVLANDPHQWIGNGFNPPRQARPVPAIIGELFEEVETGFCGVVTRVEKSGGLYVVELEGRRGVRRTFELGPGFLFEGEPVILTPPPPSSNQAVPAATLTGAGNITNSGSRRVHLDRARVAAPSRIWVEGKHDAELVEHVWGDDLRADGIVVCLLEGADNLAAVLEEFAPTAQRRAGVLLDHLVTGSKETRLAQQIEQRYGPDSVLICGHPFIDIWQAVKPQRLGLQAWPQVPRTEDFKRGTLLRLGLPHETQADIAQAWIKILRRVRSWRDLEPELIGRMEELIDFVTAPNLGVD